MYIYAWAYMPMTARITPTLEQRCTVLCGKKARGGLLESETHIHLLPALSITDRGGKYWTTNGPDSPLPSTVRTSGFASASPPPPRVHFQPEMMRRRRAAQRDGGAAGKLQAGLRGRRGRSGGGVTAETRRKTKADIKSESDGTEEGGVGFYRGARSRIRSHIY